MVKANHLIVQVENATTVRHTKRNGGCKPEPRYSLCDVYKSGATLPLKGLSRPARTSKHFT